MQRRTLLRLLGTSVAAGLLPPPLRAARPGTGGVEGIVGGPAGNPDRASLNVGWHFHSGDIVPEPLREHSASYVAAKAGGARGAASPKFDDATWRRVDLPHDWAIEAPPIASENIAQGYRKRGYGWYRRSISLEPSLEGRYLEIQFGAIATNATVWFNGTPVAHNWSGYNGFSIDITSMATFGDKPNLLAVRVDADAAEGWWYEGAGIYRDVWLVDRAPVSIATDGVHAVPGQQKDGSWHVPIVATVNSIEDKDATITLSVELLDPSRTVLAEARRVARVAGLRQTEVALELSGIAPRLWSPEDPNLYQVRTRVLRDSRIVDERITPCGFRTLRFDAGTGFYLNGVATKIKGVCIHQDHAGVGVAVPPAIVEWRVRQLKAMGCNAIRCAHGAPDSALLDACDRLGMLVMDENRNFNVSPDYAQQLEWLVRRDRNHPSVFLWSVFNEEPFQATRVGVEMVRRAAAVVKALDDSRPVTAAMSGGMFAPLNVSQAVDVVGFNYQHASYDRFHEQNPARPMLSSEDTSGFMTRGAWEADKARKIHPGDDTDQAGWGLSQRAAWKAIDTRPYLAGGFAWTGFDYHGEPTPEKWPANSSYFGILDLCGFPKSAFFLRRAMWVKDRPLLDILPHWNWLGREGTPIKVMLATNVERVELLCNGQTVGEGKPDPYDMIAFDVPFRSGVLEARGWRGGRLVARARVETTGRPVRLRLRPDRTVLAGDGVDAQPVTIEALDARGRAVPDAQLDVSLVIEGGRIIGVGNGDPTAVGPSKGHRVRLFNGLAQVIVQTHLDGQGNLILGAAADGVRPASADIKVERVRTRHSLPPSMRQAISQWRQSPILRERPATIPDLADNDMNSWDQVTAGERPAPAGSAGYVLLVSRISPSDAVFRSGGTLKFAAINGSGDIFLGGRKLASKASPLAEPLGVTVPPGQRELVVALALRASAGEPVGLSGGVFLEPAAAAESH